ncbi:MAG: hypothetical protein HYR72_27045 [Deltaproteobacteria bacterium]|nr:hypothetical protein [Deltaproteobacteria bacterium]MBI3390328.1 hypothetical protein [Deltaproteobacteria bacterium]
MPQLSVSDAVRYLLVGTQFLLFCLLFDQDGTVKLTTQLTPPVLLVLLWGIGTAWFFVYRSLLHNTVITWAKDRVGSNYRTFLIANYPGLVTQATEAEEVNFHVRLSQDARTQDWMAARASGIHFLYLTGFLAGMWFIASVVSCHGVWVSATFLVVSAAFLRAAWIDDLRMEMIETGFVRKKHNDGSLKSLIEGIRRDRG